MLYFERGERFTPAWDRALVRLMGFLETIKDDERYRKTMKASPEERRTFLSANSHLPPKMTEATWQRILDSTEEDARFERYLPLIFVDASTSDDMFRMIRAMLVNDDLYEYAREMHVSRQPEGESETRGSIPDD